jgi:hypothetical protein
VGQKRCRLQKGFRYEFYVGKDAGRVKFIKPGTYEYTVHVSATKAHAHRGTVVVK